jgi:hypothetical protein
LDVKISVDGSELKDSDPAIPCGLQAKAVFNDQYKIISSNEDIVEINEDDIAWEGDKDYKFKQVDNYEEKA